VHTNNTVGGKGFKDGVGGGDEGGGGVAEGVDV
jgi:hypothetical protein